MSKDLATEKKEKRANTVKIGDFSFSGTLKKLEFKEFKAYWDRKETKRTGLSAEEAASKFGIKVPEKKG